MGILYHTEDNESLALAMTEGEGMNKAVAIAFMLFVLLYFPCVATISTLRKEVGWQWATFSVVHSLVLAWAVAWVAFRLAGFFV
jgi:ferrous iron transport protein B